MRRKTKAQAHTLGFLLRKLCREVNRHLHIVKIKTVIEATLKQLSIEAPTMELDQLTELEQLQVLGTVVQIRANIEASYYHNSFNTLKNQENGQSNNLQHS